MANHRIKGSRLGTISYETDRNIPQQPRQIARYRTADGAEFDVPFADGAEAPGRWQCRNGMEGSLLNGESQEPKKGKRVRTPWDMLRERRTIEELDELLTERLAIIGARRRGGDGARARSRPDDGD
ncbi:RNA polymerase-binding protein RbpA [Mycolicibacterium sp. PDY-3]|uniref:RNA polymerase-binding protein RbpA n=1 Tax=Mycolicibacterium sp. PDY-3 TaxID=3376069 RepID=UPI003789A2C6